MDNSPRGSSIPLAAIIRPSSAPRSCALSLFGIVSVPILPLPTLECDPDCFLVARISQFPSSD